RRGQSADARHHELRGEGPSGPHVAHAGYNVVQENGQRKLGPPPDWQGPPPARGCEVFRGEDPADLYEDELLPVLEAVGQLYQLRLMMTYDGENRAADAVKRPHDLEIRPGRRIAVCVSVDNRRLFLARLPKDKTRAEVMAAMSDATEGVVDVQMRFCRYDRSLSRGYAFVEYESHRAACMARRVLLPYSFRLWGRDINVDWAIPHSGGHPRPTRGPARRYGRACRSAAVLSWETRLQALLRSAGVGHATFELHAHSEPGRPMGLLYKVSVPGMMREGSGFFPAVLSSSVEGAREVASELLHEILSDANPRAGPAPVATAPPGRPVRDLPAYPGDFPAPGSRSPRACRQAARTRSAAWPSWRRSSDRGR
ncbi:RNA-binding protein 47-like, partial [Lethenteron reissneri]|uniref:RNA-binding protein 47-like n=1 Tax=Lethenteron reissneri TaxID=7753 RepID=UPI002AB614F7